MDSRQKQLKKALIKTTKSIKQKYRNLHNSRIAAENILNEYYEPITKPLNQLIEGIHKPPSVPEFRTKEEIKRENGSDDIKAEKLNKYLSDDNDSIATDYFETPVSKKKDKQKLEYSSNSDILNQNESLAVASTSRVNTNHISRFLLDLSTNKCDKVYGIRKDGEQLKLGNDTVEVLEDGLKIKDKEFNFSKGLYSLLFHKNPIPGYTKKDLSEYKKMLELTNVHRKNYDSRQPIKANSSHKYHYIIKPIMAKKGSGIVPEHMTVLNKKIDYKYWDDPNELVDRLRLLISAKSAGHTGHDNEIMSIIEELREEDIIK